MNRIINLSLALIFVPAFACAQQAASTTGSEAQRKTRTSTQWPPNPHQPSRSEIEAMARAQEQAAIQEQQAAIQAARQVSPSLVDLSDGRRRGAPPEISIIVDPQLDARSKRIFPRAAYDVDQEALRMQWIVDHEQQATVNEINRTKPLQFPAR
jgi:hypothetical protein